MGAKSPSPQNRDVFDRDRVCREWGFTRRHLIKAVREGTFPTPLGVDLPPRSWKWHRRALENAPGLRRVA